MQIPVLENSRTGKIPVPENAYTNTSKKDVREGLSLIKKNVRPWGGCCNPHHPFFSWILDGILLKPTKLLHLVLWIPEVCYYIYHLIALTFLYYHKHSLGYYNAWKFVNIFGKSTLQRSFLPEKAVLSLKQFKYSCFGYCIPCLVVKKHRRCHLNEFFDCSCLGALRTHSFFFKSKLVRLIKNSMILPEILTHNSPKNWLLIPPYSR